VLAFGLLPRRHRMRFDPVGFWVQAGGLFSASDRRDPVWWPWTPKARHAREVLRLHAVRQIAPTVATTAFLHGSMPFLMHPKEY
jgi:hypothetical protein